MTKNNQKTRSAGKTKPLTNAELQARLRERRDARLRQLEDEHERGHLLKYLEEHDDNKSTEDLQERVQLLKYLEDHDDNRPIDELQERAELIRYLEDHGDGRSVEPSVPVSTRSHRRHVKILVRRGSSVLSLRRRVRMKL